MRGKKVGRRHTAVQEMEEMEVEVSDRRAGNEVREKEKEVNETL